MISAMPAVAIRRERKKSHGKVLPDSHSRQGSLGSNDNRGQRSDEERASFEGRSRRGSLPGHYNLRRKTTQSIDDYEFRKRMEYTMYTGAVLLTTGVISLLIGIMMDFVSIHRIGLLLIIIGLILLLIKLFASEHARYQTSIRIHQKGPQSLRKMSFTSQETPKQTTSKHIRSKSLHHVKTPSEVSKAHRLSVHPALEDTERENVYQNNRKKSASYTKELLRQKLERDHHKSSSSSHKEKRKKPQEQHEETMFGEDGTLTQEPSTCLVRQDDYSSSQSSPMFHLQEEYHFSPYSSPQDVVSSSNVVHSVSSPCPSVSHLEHPSPPNDLTPRPESSRPTLLNATRDVIIQMNLPPTCSNVFSRSNFHSKSVPSSSNMEDNGDRNNTEMDSSPGLRSYSCPSPKEKRLREHPPLKRTVFSPDSLFGDESSTQVADKHDDPSIYSLESPTADDAKQ